MLTEFTHLAGAHHDPNIELLDLALRLAHTPYSPLYGRHISLDREPAVTLRDLAARS
jgi:hypothetical protein